MEKIKRPNQEFINCFLAELKLLQDACSQYDLGKDYHVMNIAASLRKMLHDTRTSRSILSLLNLKEKIEFLDSANLINEANLIQSSYLTTIVCGYNESGSYQKVKPLLNGYKKPNYIKFEKWWNNIIIDDKKNKFSRRDIVLNFANKDGGCHVDSHLETGYYNLTRLDSMKYTINENSKEKPIKGFHVASIRQIGFEIVETLSNFIKLKKQ